jgi:hypothetical protein
MRQKQCSKCYNYSLYVMPAAGKTICANATCKAVFPIVKNSKSANGKA